MSVWLDQIDREPPPDIRGTTVQYYEVFDIDFAQGRPIAGHVQLQALKTRDGREDRLLDSPSGAWTRHLSARLFRDGLEVVPAEYEIRFSPVQGRGQHGDAGSVIVTKDRPLEATFTLSGPDGASLEPAVYRLWIMLDLRDLPPAPGVFRGFAVNDAGEYYLHGKPDPARKAGLVFRVYEVGSDLELKARSLMQRAAREEMKAMALEARPLRPGAPPSDWEGGAGLRRKAIELALEGLRHAPRDVDLLAIVARNHVMLNECDAALPYFKAVWAIDPNYFTNAFHQNMLMRSCMTSETVAPDPR